MLRSTRAKSPCTKRVSAVAAAANGRSTARPRVAVDGDVACRRRAGTARARPRARRRRTCSRRPCLRGAARAVLRPRRHDGDVIAIVRATAVREIRQHPQRSPRIRPPALLHASRSQISRHVAQPGDDDVAREPGMGELSGREHDPALTVELGLGGSAYRWRLMSSLRLKRVEPPRAGPPRMLPTRPGCTPTRHCRRPC